MSTILLALVVALITSPVVATLVSIYFGRIKDVPLLNFSKIVLNISFRIDSVTITNCDTQASGILSSYLYDIAFNLNDNVSYTSYVRTINRLETLYHAIGVEDDNELNETVRQMFSACTSVRSKEHLSICVNIAVATLRSIIFAIERDCNSKSLE